MFEKLLQRPIIPVIVIDDASSAEPLAEALLEGGLDIIEITFRTAAASEAIERIRKAFPEMLVGAGTIIDEQQAQQALNAGISFAVAPGLNPKIVKFFQGRGVLFIPGVMTPSEIEQGLELGCQLQKFFPAEAAGGVRMLKALAGPYKSRGVQFVPTGGINVDNMNDYLALPNVANVGGSWLATKQQIASQDWKKIADQAKTTLSIAANINPKKNNQLANGFHK
ncbi:MAG: bifunctional 4-hydroxy-2-oxoglutarate aldolase/2-dehydro-3-deoxy-phosphogluconate aldolase [Deltaproteobacteria bacterium]|nr:bifunctional 4-hydroxy-2-oxoglutarate aldolase/2-dehydro-3-deoxy-phosphogluconate aldolase [Deltaproteobacteria bacterium]